MIDLCSEPGCDKKVDRDGVCFRHRVASIGVNWVGGAMKGKRAFHRSKQDYLQEHYGVRYDKELSRARPDIGRYDG